MPIDISQSCWVFWIWGQKPADMGRWAQLIEAIKFRCHSWAPTFKSTLTVSGTISWITLRLSFAAKGLSSKWTGIGARMNGKYIVSTGLTQLEMAKFNYNRKWQVESSPFQNSFFYSKWAVFSSVSMFVMYKWLPDGLAKQSLQHSELIIVGCTFGLSRLSGSHVYCFVSTINWDMKIVNYIWIVIKLG